MNCLKCGSGNVRFKVLEWKECLDCKFEWEVQKVVQDNPWTRMEYWNMEYLGGVVKDIGGARKLWRNVPRGCLAVFSWEEG